MSQTFAIDIAIERARAVVTQLEGIRAQQALTTKPTRAKKLPLRIAGHKFVWLVRESLHRGQTRAHRFLVMDGSEPSVRSDCAMVSRRGESWIAAVDAKRCKHCEAKT